MNELTKNIDLFETFDEIHANLASAFADIQKALDTIDTLQAKANVWDIKRLVTPEALNRVENVRHYSKDIDALGWNIFLERSGYAELFDAQTRDEWNKNLQNGNCPEFNRENAENLFGGLFKNKQNIIELGIINAFKNLSWDHKTNLPSMFSKKVITSISAWGRTHLKSLYSIDDLVKFSYMMYNEKANVLFSEVYINEISKIYKEWDGKIEIKMYKNGNCHITFLDENIPEKLNSVIAKHYPNTLPNPRNKK